MRRGILVWLFLIPFSVFGQNKRASVQISEEIVWAGVDRPGDLFLVTLSGELLKYSPQGVLIGKFKYPYPPLIDAGDGVQSFYYLQKENRFGYLTYEVNKISESTLDPSFAISPWLVCPSIRELWIFDVSDFSFKKTKAGRSTIAFEWTMKTVPEKAASDFISLREYQNYLFLQDKTKGILLFSNLGKLMRTIGEPGLMYFNFLGEEIYYIKDNQLVLVDLYTEEKRVLPLPQSCSIALLTDTTLYTIDKNEVSLYDFRP